MRASTPAPTSTPPAACCTNSSPDALRSPVIHPLPLPTNTFASRRLVPSSVDPTIPRALDAVVMKALAKNPLNRYQTAAEMRNDLARAIAEQPVQAESVMSEDERTQYIGRPVAAPIHRWCDADGLPVTRYGRVRSRWRSPDDGRKRAIVWISVVAALLLVLGVTAFLLFRGNDKERHCRQAGPGERRQRNEPDRGRRAPDAWNRWASRLWSIATPPVNSDTIAVGTLSPSRPRPVAAKPTRAPRSR